MMRSMAKALGACAAAAMLALATPGAAHAAQGVLFIDRVPQHDPSGCYPLGDFAPSEIANFTDEVAWVWSGPFCNGRVTQEVRPGEVTIGHGWSVYIQ